MRFKRPNRYPRAIDQGAYMPTPDDIAQATAAIRAGWSETEHRKRAGVVERPVFAQTFSRSDVESGRVWQDGREE